MRIVLILLLCSFSLAAMDKDRIIDQLRNASLEDAAAILLQAKMPADSDDEDDRSPLQNFNDLLLFFMSKAVEEEAEKAGDE